MSFLLSMKVNTQTYKHAVLWVWSLVGNIKRGHRVPSTNDWMQEGVRNRTKNVVNDELHNVCHLSRVGSLKNSFKAYMSFILRRTIMKFVVKCSAIQKFLLKNKKPTRCHLLYLLYFLDIQHVSGINMSIFRSMRLCCWTTTLAVLFLDCCVLELGCALAGVVSGLPAASMPEWQLSW